MKKVIIFIVLLSFLSQLIIKWPDKFLHIIACDVGQGDAILFKIGYFQALIDVGPDERVLNCLNNHLPFWDKKIDLLVLTHFDDDHIGGFRNLSQIYAIKYLFLPLTAYKDSEAFLELKTQIASIQSLGTVVKEPFLGQQIAFSEFSHEYQAKYNSINQELLFSFITPFELDLEEYESLESRKLFLWQKPENYLSAEEFKKLAYKISDNNGSIAILSQFGNMKILLLGDLESTRELAIVSAGLIADIDIQKIGHHGSKTSTSMEIISKAQPEIALISCGLNNKFGHPNKEVLDNLESSEAQVLRTDELGDVEIIGDGQKFWLKDKKQSLF